MFYDIILRNNASGEFFLLQGLIDRAETELYLEFEEVELNVPDGEYTYAAFVNDRDDVSYTFKTPLLDTIVHTTDRDIVLKDIQPFTGLMRVGNVESINIYDEENVEYPYDDNNDIIYYEG